MHKAAILTLGISFGALAGCQTDTLPEIEVADTSLPTSATQGPSSKPIFENSVVSNDIDFIKTGDPAVNY